MFNLFRNNKNNHNVEALLQKGAFLVDVRTPKEYANGSAKNAVNIPLQNLQEHLNEFDNKEAIVVFCRSGNRSGQAKKILQENGYMNVENGGSVDNVVRLIEKVGL